MFPGTDAGANDLTEIARTGDTHGLSVRAAMIRAGFRILSRVAEIPGPRLVRTIREPCA